MSEFGDESTAEEGGTALSVRIVSEVAGLLDTDPVELPPLAESVDLDALSTLVGSTDAEVEFDYADVRVYVDADANVAVRASDRTP